MSNLTKERRKQFLFYKRSHKNNPTKYERMFANILKKRRIYYLDQKGFIINEHNFFIVDFYVPVPHKIVFEVDGEYHSTIKQSEYDKLKDNFLKTRVIITYHIRNSDLDIENKVDSFLDIIFRQTTTGRRKEKERGMVQ